MMMEQWQCLYTHCAVDANDDMQTAVQHVTQGNRLWELKGSPDNQTGMHTLGAGASRVDQWRRS